jgi:DNA-binding MarR family transcriptional regulator
VDDTWFSRDLPVLEAAVRLNDADPYVGPTVRDIAADTGVDSDAVMRALKALEHTGYVEVRWMMSGGGSSRVSAVDERARRIAGAWPSAEDLADRILAVLDERIEHAGDDEERSKWSKIRAGVLSAGRDFLVELSAAVLTRQIPGAG